MKDRFLLILSNDYVTAGAPITGGTIGIYSFFQQMIPILTVLSILIGIVLGIMSYRLKRKLILKQLEELEEAK